MPVTFTSIPEDMARQGMLGVGIPGFGYRMDMIWLNFSAQLFVLFIQTTEGALDRRSLPALFTNEHRSPKVNTPRQRVCSRLLQKVRFACCRHGMRRAR